MNTTARIIAVFVLLRCCGRYVGGLFPITGLRILRLVRHRIVPSRSRIGRFRGYDPFGCPVPEML